MMLSHLFACFRPCRDSVEKNLTGYKIVKTLGRGVCGSVHSAIKKDSWQPCALKSACLSGPAWQLEMAHREALALCQVGFRHVNLVQPVELVLSGSQLTLALKLCTGGTLESYCKKHYISEDMACYLLRQLVAVVKHLHSREIAYRDIKLENLLLDSKPTHSKPAQLVLCDLGTAKSWKGRPSPVMDTFVGTPGFMSPQVLASMFNASNKAAAAAAAQAGEHADSDSSNHSSGTAHSSHFYDATKADVWAIGAVLHYMLRRTLPYDYDSFAPLLPPQKALVTLYQLEHEYTWRQAGGSSRLRRISPEAQDLLDKMLHPHEEQRISMSEVLSHPWFQRRLPENLQQALDSMQQQQAVLDAAAREKARAPCKKLAAQAADLLFQLSRSPAMQQSLQQDHRTLSVPLSVLGMQLAAGAHNRLPEEQQAVQHLQQVLQQLEQEALSVGHVTFAGSCSRSRLSGASASTQQQQQDQQFQVSGQQCQQLAQAACGKLPACSDDTCYVKLQACLNPGQPLLQVEA